MYRGRQGLFDFSSERMEMPSGRKREFNEESADRTMVVFRTPG
jgi:hypothetical protein